jgi:hypothetical protein
MVYVRLTFSSVRQSPAVTELLVVPASVSPVSVGGVCEWTGVAATRLATLASAKASLREVHRLEARGMSLSSP